MSEKKVVFIEFTADWPHNGAKHYFVGDSVQSIMDDTAEGTEFGFSKFSSYRKMTESEIRLLNLGYLDKGVESIKMGHSKSFSLDSSQQNLK